MKASYTIASWPPPFGKTRSTKCSVDTTYSLFVRPLSSDVFPLWRRPSIILRCVPEIFPRREHAPLQQLLSAAAANLFRPVHPTVLVQSQIVPRVFVRREPQVVQPKQHHARRAIRPVQRRLARQREIRHPFGEPRTNVRPPQKLGHVFRVQRGEAALRFEHLARAAIDVPANIKRQLRLYAHGFSSCAAPFALHAAVAAAVAARTRASPAVPRTPTAARALPRASHDLLRGSASPPPARPASASAGAATARRCLPAGTASAWPVRRASTTWRTARRSTSRRESLRPAFAVAPASAPPVRPSFASNSFPSPPSLPFAVIQLARRPPLLRPLRARFPRRLSTLCGRDLRNPPRSCCKRARSNSNERIRCQFPAPDACWALLSPPMAHKRFPQISTV